MAMNKILWIAFAVVAVFSFLTFATRSNTQIETPTFVQEDYLNHTTAMVPFTRSDSLPKPTATVTWNGLGVDNNWSTGLNWSTGAPPATNDLARFDATSTKNCTVDVATNALSQLQMLGGYTGTVTVAVNQTNTWGALTITDVASKVDKSTFNVTVSTVSLAGGDLISTSGSFIATGNLSTTSANSAISFGAGTWEFRGTYSTSLSTDSAVWNAGTANVSFTSAANAGISPNGATLAEPEFYNATFNSTGTLTSTFTISAGTNLWVSNTLTVNDTVGTTQLLYTDRTITAGAIVVSNNAWLTNQTIGSLITSNITVSGNGILITRSDFVRSFQISTSTSTFTLVPYDWVSYAPPSSLSFSINPSLASAIMSFVFGGMTPDLQYDFYRDSTLLKSAIADGAGEISFAVSGGWSNHTVLISQTQIPNQTNYIPLIISLVIFITFAILGFAMAQGVIIIFDGIFGVVVALTGWTLLGDYALVLVAFIAFEIAIGVGELLEG